MTKQRRLILKVLVDSKAHLTAEEIYDRAKSLMPEIALGTIYRNLGVLLKDGEIRKIEVTGEAARYDGNVSPHEHIVCTVCGKVEDIKLDGMDKWITSLKKYNVSGYMLTLYHICDDCRGK